MAEITGKKHIVRAVLVISGVSLVTFVGIMYFKKCYVVINNKRYGFNPNK